MTSEINAREELKILGDELRTQLNHFADPETALSPHTSLGRWVHNLADLMIGMRMRVSGGGVVETGELQNVRAKLARLKSIAVRYK